MPGKSRNIFISLLLILRAIRWYNVALVIISQYLIAFFVFQKGTGVSEILYDYRLHLIVISTSMSLAGAFLINGFYDIDKDLVNHPNRVVLLRLLGQNFLLNSYAVITITAILLALIASVKVFIFVSGLVFLFWFYSHKLQKLPLVREITATVLAIAPFIAVWLHYGVMHLPFMIYLGSLAIVGFTREVIKDLEGNKGNIIFGYFTVVVAAGQTFTKRWLALINVLLTISFTLGFFAFVRQWDYFMLISGFSIVSALLVSLASLLASSKSLYQIADTMLKVVIVVHLVSLVFASGLRF